MPHVGPRQHPDRRDGKDDRANQRENGDEGELVRVDDQLLKHRFGRDRHERAQAGPRDGQRQARCQQRQTMPSVTDCRTMRPLRAPSAALTASSRTRAMLRPSPGSTRSRSRSPSADQSTAGTGRSLPRSRHRRSDRSTGTSRIVTGHSFRGCSLARAAPIADSSVAACSKVTPSLRRARSRRLRASRGPCGSTRSGSHASTSAMLPNSISGCGTPTTVKWSRPIWSVRPMTSSRPWNSARQKWSASSLAARRRRDRRRRRKCDRAGGSLPHAGLQVGRGQRQR